MPDNSGAIDLGSLSPEEQKVLEEMADATGTYPGDQNPDDNKRKVLTAFIVVVGYDGNPEVMAFDDPDLLVQSQPTPDLVYGACSTVIKDLEVQESAQAAAQMTAQVMLQQARAIAEQQHAAQVAASLGPNLRG